MGKGRGGYGGFGGGMPANMNNLLKQAQKMQKQMEEAQAALEEEQVSATAGGGAVEVVVSGKKELVSIEIDKEVVDPEDVEMLEDLIVAAVNEGLRKMTEISNEKMSKATGGYGGAGGLF
ncbi:MAG: YbaB/EbfC family nucleoid-associated protein [Parasporobacterium sp.]|nr:YbaB/EbfC family nucleoid-associated protein [Parasporobacterium sp.]